MPDRIVTVVDATVDTKREADLLAGFERMNAQPSPDGFIRSELLRGQGGAWRIQTTWRDLDAVVALRAQGVRPAALDLLESVGAEHSHGVFTVAQAYE